MLAARGRSRGARHGRDALCLADVTVARRLDFGKNDRTATTLTHLGHLLKAGDHVWGYCVAASTLGTELEPVDAAKLPEVILVKKSYSDKRHRQRRRVWKLRGLEKEAEPGVQRGRQFETGACAWSESRCPGLAPASLALLLRRVQVSPLGPWAIMPLLL